MDIHGLTWKSPCKAAPPTRAWNFTMDIVSTIILLMGITATRPLVSSKQHNCVVKPKLAVISDLSERFPTNN
jgi:hypothetical protein